MAGDAGFGTVFVDQMSVATWARGVWDAPKLRPLAPLGLHPGAHALHYGSACFEGLKAHRGIDATVHIFRLDRHVERLRASAEALVLPVPPSEMVSSMVIDLVRAALAEVPDAPGALYLRPTLIGTDPNIGAASLPASQAILFVIASPVGDYFARGPRPLSLAIETQRPRTTPQFGRVKTGANYAMALGITVHAVDAWGVDQVLFAPGGQIQETGASNFVLVDDERLVTPERDASLLNGVTLDSVVRIAADLGYHVEERRLTVDEVLDWAARPRAEAALSGTAAVLAGVGSLVCANRRTTVGNGQVGPHTLRLRDVLTQIQRGKQPDPDHWLTPVTP
jgi:branched-chain amino acid aminotransferase